MAEYREPVDLATHSARRILLRLGSSDPLDVTLRHARKLYPSPDVLIVVVEPDATRRGRKRSLRRFQAVMQHPASDVTVLGTPLFDDLEASWRVDHLLIRDPSGVLCDTTRRSSS